MKFKNREEAAEQLLNQLQKYRDQNPLVLGIPRGAVPMAKIIAEGLKGDLGVMLVHKIPAPFNEEFAIASIGLSGKIHHTDHLGSVSVSEEYLERAAQKQLEVLQARFKQYQLPEASLNYRDRIVIIVDDGIATGATTISAIHEVRHQKPKKLVVAAPVSAAESKQKIEPLVDDLVILHAPEVFYAVGQFYESFTQVSDDEVIDILNEWYLKHEKNGI